MLELGESFWYRLRTTGRHSLVVGSVAHMQEVGVDEAEPYTDLLPFNAAAIALRPGLEAGEDLEERMDVCCVLLAFLPKILLT